MNANATRSIDEYIAAVTEPARSTLAGLRQLVHDAVPDAVEAFGYGMPGFKYRGKPLVYLAAAKNHCSLYGLDAEQAKRAGYDAEKGTIRFPHDSPPDPALVERLLQERVAAIEGASKGKRGR